MDGSDGESKQSRRDKNGTEYRFKLAWWEEEGKCSVAMGNSFWIDSASSLLHFDGSHGEIIIPTKMMKFVIK
jgi:hypothetical protein